MEVVSGQTARAWIEQRLRHLQCLCDIDDLWIEHRRLVNAAYFENALQQGYQRFARAAGPRQRLLLLLLAHARTARIEHLYIPVQRHDRRAQLVVDVRDEL